MSPFSFYNAFPSTAADIANSNDAADSPSFPNQEIIDPDLDWIYLKNRTFTNKGDYSTDIEAVDYYSDGITLNAILWLRFPFQVNPSPLNENVYYGMYIDADFNQATGYGGIEYKSQISWNNQSKTWTKVLEKWSHFGDPLVLDNQTISYTNFSKKDAHYVLLSVDLNTILSPDKYKVIFYAEVRRNNFLISDFTRMISIPPLELAVSTSPNSVELRKDEEKTIEVRVNTTQGYEPTVNLNARSQSKHIIFDFTQNDTTINPDYTLRIPSYGIATIPLSIRSSEDASVGPKTLFIFANSSFPPEELIKPRPLQERTTSFLPSSLLASENIFSQASSVVMLTEPITLIDHISNFWNKVGDFVSFVTGIVIGYIGPWVFNKIKKEVKNHEISKK